ncbi:MAG: transketolase [Balneolaceae bacterium]|nr:transketolase [Balneolaceae bacterium]
MTTDNLETSREFARQIRRDALALLYHAGSGHPGGSLSSADLVAWLWQNELHYRAGEWEREDRNRLVLSKGHCVPIIYAAAGNSGLIDPSEAADLRHIGTRLQGHAHVGDTPWVETSTGSLGQGFSVSIGMAMGLRHRGIGSRVYAIVGDGEMQEGEIWEGAMCAAHHGLDNLTAILDYNKMQSDDLNENIMGIAPIVDKWRSFNWEVQEIDGHDMEQIASAVAKAKEVKGRPQMIVAHTIKGKGVSYMEGVPTWHGSAKIKKDEFITALEELGITNEDMKPYLNGTFWNGQ